MVRNYDTMPGDEQDRISNDIHQTFIYWAKGQNKGDDPGLISEDIYWKENIADRFYYEGEGDMTIVKTPPMLKSYLSSRMSLREVYAREHKTFIHKYNSEL